MVSVARRNQVAKWTEKKLIELVTEAGDSTENIARKQLISTTKRALGSLKPAVQTFLVEFVVDHAKIYQLGRCLGDERPDEQWGYNSSELAVAVWRDISPKHRDEIKTAQKAVASEDQAAQDRSEYSAQFKHSSYRDNYGWNRFQTKQRDALVEVFAKFSQEIMVATDEKEIAEIVARVGKTDFS